MRTGWTVTYSLGGRQTVAKVVTVTLGTVTVVKKGLVTVKFVGVTVVTVTVRTVKYRLERK